MCNHRYYDAISVGVSILVGIVLSVLGALNVLTAGIAAPLIGIGLGALCLLLITIAAVSPERQATQYSACLCQRAVRLLVSSLMLLAVSGFTIVFLVTNVIFALVLGFFIFTLTTYTGLSLYCLLSCLTRVGCTDTGTAAACVIRM